MSTSQLSRRTFTQRSILGLVGVGLMTAATGIPPWFLGSRRATARPRQDEVEPERAQLLILSTSAAGDPVNANAPGTYGFPDIIRSADPSMAETAIQLGNVQTTAARVWSTLPQWVLDRTAFIHHSTPTQIHPDHPKVLALWEKTPDKEAFPAVFTRYLGPALGTVISTPVSAGAGPVLKVRGRTIADQSPLLLRDLLAQPQGPLTTLATLRDETLDKMHAELKANGTPDQRRFLDDIAISRSQARNLSDDVLGILGEIESNDNTGQLLAAVALLKLKLSSAVAINLRFGRDNHADEGLVNEVAEHQTGVAAISQLMERLRAEGLEDQTTFAMLNVFGRTMRKNGLQGRDHWKNLHTTVMIGRHVKAGVYGGLKRHEDGKFSDYTSMAINPVSGAGEDGAAIAFEDTFFAAVKTLGRAIGVREETLKADIEPGQPIAAALN